MKKFVLFLILAALGLNCDLFDVDPVLFNFKIVPQSMNAINGQRCVLLVMITDDQTKGESVTFSAKAENCEIIVENNNITQGEICEITVIPKSLPGKEIDVQVSGARNGLKMKKSMKIKVVLGVDLAGPSAARIRDRFVEWLAGTHPDLGITPQTEWTGTLVTPQLTIVANYLYFSDTWEMGVSWHVMIPPNDWAKIYLRRRFESAEPEMAFEISSLQSNENPVAIAPPDAVTR